MENILLYEIFLIKGDPEDSDGEEYYCNEEVLLQLLQVLGITMN